MSKRLADTKYLAPGTALTFPGKRTDPTTTRAEQRALEAAASWELRAAETAVLRAFRGRLARLRDDGTPFDDAWHAALAPIADEDWLAVLAATKTTWHRAFDGRQPVGGEDAAARVGALSFIDEHRATQGERLVA